jgi:signal transduction histidine kinase
LEGLVIPFPYVQGDIIASQLPGIMGRIVAQRLPHLLAAALLIHAQVIHVHGKGIPQVVGMLHLLQNAVEYTPEGGKITLDYKKRGQHTHQFLVSDTGEGIPEEKRDDLFKPFLEIRDLTQGDGLGLPICKQMALRMNGDLDLDPAFTKGTRFVLELHT